MNAESALNTANPEAIQYHSGELAITVLGGIRLDGLDRMRVTLKVSVTARKFRHYLNNPELAALAIRHNLDLYNDVQVEKLTRKVADRLEIGSSAIAKTLADLTTQLENFRLAQIEQQAKKKADKRKVLTETERAEAENFLRTNDLIPMTNQLIGTSGVVGEEKNRLLLYLIFTSRKMTRPLHAISFGSSGTGKSHLQEKVGELMPDEEKIEITSLTENAFYYFGQQELRGKLILIEDLDGAENVLYPLRELQSKRSITKTVTVKTSNGQTKTQTLRVEGPVSVAGCTTKESVYEDNANRSFLLYLDESKEQDERVMDYQRALSAGTINTAAEQQAKELLKNAQRILQPVTVRNPFAQLLKLPEGVFKPRRTNAHYLQFIEAVTFYHQRQRRECVDEQTGEAYIETTIEDIAIANELMKEALLRKTDQLTGACRSYFEQLKKHLAVNQQATFTNKAISREMRLPLSTVKRHNLELLNGGYLKLKEKKKDDREKAHRYEVVSYEEYKALQEKVGTVLDQILQQLTGPSPAHAATEPMKPAPVKPKRQQPRSSSQEISA
jgi:hypothetical protein